MGRGGGGFRGTRKQCRGGGERGEKAARLRGAAGSRVELRSQEANLGVAASFGQLKPAAQPSSASRPWPIQPTRPTATGASFSGARMRLSREAPGAGAGALQRSPACSGTVGRLPSRPIPARRQPNPARNRANAFARLGQAVSAWRSRGVEPWARRASLAKGKPAGSSPSAPSPGLAGLTRCGGRSLAAPTATRWPGSSGILPREAPGRLREGGRPAEASRAARPAEPRAGRATPAPRKEPQQGTLTAASEQQQAIPPGRPASHCRHTRAGTSPRARAPMGRRVAPGSWAWRASKTTASGSCAAICKPRRRCNAK